VDPRDAFAPDVLGDLIGTWRGSGVAELPSTEPVRFHEEIRFTRRSETSLHYWQRATGQAEGALLHSEAGIWRTTDAGGVEISIALPGATEMSEGTLAPGSIWVSSTAIARAATAARLTDVVRNYSLGPDRIDYEISIGTEGFALRGHIRGSLARA
jgi:subtilisin family serine protease